ncbi:MAG: Rieske 2Fe-2S domain-containing protein [Rhodospirillaceae bacterium]|nr:Rieske 2Fe-2S domain-containing protein [Rhodospirillaceae bacterium]
MYMNFWYAAAESHELVAGTPMHIKMLGQEFVLFRDSAGKAHLLSNICVHRGASLAHGKVKGDTIECPYHGWQFQGKDGVCTKIPSLGKDGKIPARAKVDSYPVEERYGLIFTFLGDLPESERPPLMDIPEWDDAKWRFTSMNYTWRADWQRAMENSLDPAHTEFVHPSMGYQGDREDYEVPELQIIEHDWGVGTMTQFVSPDLPHEKMRGLKGEGQMEAGSTTWGIGQSVTRLHFTPVMWAHQYTYTTPIDELHIKRYFLQGRNFRIEEHMDAPVNERNAVIVDQDKVVVTRLEPFNTPASSTEEVMVKSDTVIVRFREKLKAFTAKGWKIDVDAISATKHKKAYAIPSPARRTNKGWALDAVPTVSVDAVAPQVAAE